MKLPKSFYNWTSLIGATIALISLFMIIFLFIISLIYRESGSYLGLVIYIVLPVFLVLGLIIIPIGMIRKHRKDKRGEVSRVRRWPIFDFNEQRTRNGFSLFAIGTTLFLLLSAMGSYEAFHYTESVKFCGTLCHRVMKPEYVAYQNSAHARVACVDCHVGTGANWYVRSKLSGLYQVYATLLNIYPRPIPTPIKNLRPARETCEECHWPEKFYAHQLVKKVHYLADGSNTEWTMNLMLKIGPEHSSLGLLEGIHWHINPEVTIEYVSTSLDREIIPWVRYTNKKTGKKIIYEDSENPLQPGQLDTLEIRTMDCIDCHNRPSHHYNTPITFINDALTSGKIPRELPDIKFLAMDLLYHKEYSTEDSALLLLDSEVRAYYEMMYPEITEGKREMVDQAINGIQGEFRKNIFPEMKVTWKAYVNHLSHVESDGCFRCHNNRHTSSDGAVISRDCNNCHHILSQGTPDNMQTSVNGESQEFHHLNDNRQAWKEKLCSECHRELY